MPLKSRITEDMKDAMRAKDAARLSAIRMLLAAIKQREVDERIELSDADVLSVIEKMIKQRKDSITQFEAGKREDLAAIERAEVAVLGAYLPAQLSDVEGHGSPEAQARRPRRPGRRFRQGQGEIGVTPGSGSCPTPVRRLCPAARRL
jgi:hypothetical protein